MRFKDYMKIMEKALENMRKEYGNMTVDNDINGWQNAMDSLVAEANNEEENYCETCNSTGYCERQLDVDDFESYPCPDCNPDDDYDFEYMDPTPDQYRDWAGIEDPYKEPRH